MANKSSVSALQEHCQQNKLPEPTYEYITGEDGGFVCQVEFGNEKAMGFGRSKRDAKHSCAQNMLGLVKLGHFEKSDNKIFDIIQTSDVDIVLSNTSRDMIKELRDFCVRNDMPLPTIEVIQQCGTPDAPEFLARCRLASIERYAKSDKKKDARQKVATVMLHVISNSCDEYRSHTSQIASVNNTNSQSADDLESERRQKFKTYRELTEAGRDKMEGIKICDRHNYFKSFYPHMKENAWKIIKSNEYLDSETKARALLTELKLSPKVVQVNSVSIKKLQFIELNCDFDAAFLGFEDEIWSRIITYFQNMLV